MNHSASEGHRSARQDPEDPRRIQFPSRERFAERNQPFRILHVAEVIRGGTATYLTMIAPIQLAEFGAENLRFLIPAVYQRDIDTIPACHVTTVPISGRGLMAHWTYFRALGRVLREFRPSLIHAHGSFGGLYVRLHAMLIEPGRRPLIVYCAHGWAFQRKGAAYKRWLYIAAERLLAGFCDAVVNISCSELDAAIAAGIPAHKQVLVYNGLADIPEDSKPASLPHDGDKLTLLFVGRLDVQKGIDILLEVLRSIDPDRCRLYIAGEAVVPGEDIAQRLGPIPSNVTLLGWQSPAQLAQLYAGVDAVVIPSRWEGFGYVALEAMRAGRAVIASRTGGLPEIVEHGRTGLLFDIGDSMQLTRIIMQGSRAEFAELGRNGRVRFLAEFTERRMNSLLLSLYRDLRAGAGVRLWS
ncbi:MAG TPA: glycosyltransferase [Stellaceae bacterium]|nr:glycosyltransferase [Stellaceae bacterium]